jgi:hypothetical protein
MEALVPMPIAAALAYRRMTGKPGAVRERERDCMAQVLAGRLAVYSNARPVSAAELRLGKFTEGGATFAFRDHRAAVKNLAVSREALRAATEELARKPAAARIVAPRAQPSL